MADNVYCANPIYNVNNICKSKSSSDGSNCEELPPPLTTQVSCLVQLFIVFVVSPLSFGMPPLHPQNAEVSKGSVILGRLA